MRRKTAAFLLFCTTLFCAAYLRAGGDAQPTVDEIFKNHADAVGYSAMDGRAKPYIEKCRVTTHHWFGHTQLTELVRHQAGAYFRVDSTELGATTSGGFNEGGFWYSSANDNASDDTGLDEALDITSAAIHAEAFDETLNAELRGTKGSDYVVRIKPPSGVSADIYFNRDTWLIDRYFIDPDRLSLQAEFSNYKRQGPVMVAMTQKFGSPGMRSEDFTVHDVEDFQWDAPFDAAIFNAPQPKHYMVYPKSGSGTIPFDFHDGIIFEASLNGGTGRILLDFSVSGLYVTPLLAAKAKLIPDDPYANWYGKLQDYPVVNTVAFGDVELKNVRVGIYDGNYFGVVDGVMGYDVFAQSVVDIDFPRRTITFSDPSTFVPPPGRHAFPLSSIRGVAQVVVPANGFAPLLLEFAPALLGQLALWTGVTNSQSFADKVGLSRGFLGELDIGSKPLQHVRVDEDPFARDLWTSYTGSVGALEGGLLQQYDVIFDYPKSVVYIDPVSNP